MKKLLIAIILLFSVAEVIGGQFVVSKNQDRDTRPLRDTNEKTIGRITVGAECETKPIIINGRYVWHHVTNKAGLRGLAVCHHQNTNTLPDETPPPETTTDDLTDSGPIIISGKTDVVISGLRITNPNGNCVHIRNSSTRITIENSEIGPCGDIGIKIENSDNIIIRNSYIHDTKTEGVWSYESHHITIESNRIIDVRSGYEGWTTKLGNLSFTNNYVKNVHYETIGVSGPGDNGGGNVVAFNFVKGGGNRITDNVGINIFGQSNPLDLINVYKSNGAATDPILIARNKLNGGGPSRSGGGIILGDTNGSYQLAEDNVLVNPGQYGLAITGGHHNTLRNNRVYSDDQRSFTNVGLFVWRVNHPTEGGTPPGDCYENTVELNQVTWWRGPDYKGNGLPASRSATWKPSTGSDGVKPNCGSVAGWSNNKFDTDSAQPANLDASLWDAAWDTL